MDLRDELKLILQRIEAMEKKIERAFKQNAVCQLLETISGGGGWIEHEKISYP